MSTPRETVTGDNRREQNDLQFRTDVYNALQKLLNTGDALTLVGVNDDLKRFTHSGEQMEISELVEGKHDHNSLVKKIQEFQKYLRNDEECGIDEKQMIKPIAAEVTGKVIKTLETSSSPETPKSHKPFPEGTEIQSLRDHVRDSWNAVQKLSPEKQSKISYYEKAGEWFINLNGTKISLQDESAEENKKLGIYKDSKHPGETWFSQEAAWEQGRNKGRELPTNNHWEQMAEFLCPGDDLKKFKILRDVLDIHLNGWFHPDHGLHGSGVYAGVWSAFGRECLDVGADGGIVYHTGGSASGRSVRLLDA